MPFRRADLEPPPSYQSPPCTSAAEVRSQGTVVTDTDICPIARKHGASSHTTDNEATRNSTDKAISGPATQHSSCLMHNGDHAVCAPSSSNRTLLSSLSVLPNRSKSQAQPHTSSSSSVVAITAAPATRTFFDPWNSSSTGHQRAENRLSGSTSWRECRNLKLSEQFKGGLGGGNRVPDTVGAGSANFGKDGRKPNGGWERGAKGLRTGGQKSLAEVWGASKAGKKSSQDEKEKDPGLEEHWYSADILQNGADENIDMEKGGNSDNDLQETFSRPTEKQIFSGLCFYLNGSTAPLVSDHKLKHMLARRGAKTSIALGRRSVTHVILGTVSNSTHGAGGGLAASKIQKEIGRTGGKAVNFVTAEWVLESIKADCRLPESRFSPLKLASKSQGSIHEMFRSAAPG